MSVLWSCSRPHGGSSSPQPAARQLQVAGAACLSQGPSCSAQISLVAICCPHAAVSGHFRRGPQLSASRGRWEGAGLRVVSGAGLCRGPWTKGRLLRRGPGLQGLFLLGEGGGQEIEDASGVGHGQRRARGQSKGQLSLEKNSRSYQNGGIWLHEQRRCVWPCPRAERAPATGARE